MSEKKGKPVAALVLSILILITSLAFAGFVFEYDGEYSYLRPYALYMLAIVVAIWLFTEILTIIRFAKVLNEKGLSRSLKNSVAALVLMNANDAGIRTWDLRNKTGLIIGRGNDSSDVDIDLSDTEYFSFISTQHAVLNFTEKGWMLTDACSQNGTSLLRRKAKQKLLLAPGEPVPIRNGDVIYIAEETRLAVK